MKKPKIEKDTPQTSRAAGVIFCITGVIFLLMYSINSGWFWCLPVAIMWFVIGIAMFAEAHKNAKAESDSDEK